MSRQFDLRIEVILRMTIPKVLSKNPVNAQFHELGWSNPFTIQHFCLVLRRSYNLVSSTITIQRKKKL